MGSGHEREAATDGPDPEEHLERDRGLGMAAEWSSAHVTQSCKAHAEDWRAGCTMDRRL